MLTEIRDRSSGWFAWIIAGLIIVPMAFWGVNEYATTEATPTLVEVGDQKISQNAFQAQLSNAQAQARARNPNLANSDIFNSDFYKRQVLDGMIDRAVIEEIANSKNYQIGDRQLADLIKKSPQFQENGKFDKDAYERYVATQAFSKAQFEDQTRSNSKLFQVGSGYGESAIVLPDEVRELLEIQSEQRSFDIVTVKQADFVEGIVISDGDISEYYQANTDSFLNPDRISISYVELTAEQIASSIKIDDAKIRQIYDDNVDSYISPETRATSHILLSTTGGEDEDQQLAKADDLETQLRNGADFATLAKENSQDPGSAAQGGSLGDVEVGQMVPEFEEATFALTEGEISVPVKSQFGYHIIKVDKIKGGVAQPFEEVKQEIEQEERDTQTEDLLLERVEQLRSVVFDQSESLDAAAEQLNLKILTTGLFARDNGDAIASNEAVRAAAFSDLVKNQGKNSEPIELADGVYVAVRKLNFEASAPKALAEVSAQIKTTLTNERASAAAKAAGDSILERAELNWNELAKDETLKIDTHTVTMIDTEQKVAPDVLRTVLKMQLDGVATKVESFSGVAGDFNIIRLHKIAPGDVSKVSEQIKESTRRLIAQRNGQSLFQSYLKGVGKPYREQINEDLL